MRKPPSFVIAACFGLAAPVAAQAPLPGLENFTLERPQPTPTATATPTVSATPAAQPSPAATPSRVAPEPTPTPAARPAPTSTPAATQGEAPQPQSTATAPAATAAPVAEATYAPMPTPTADRTPEVGGAEATGSSTNWTMLGLIAVLVLVGVAGLLWWQRRTAASDHGADAVPAAEPTRAASTTDLPAAKRTPEPELPHDPGPQHSPSNPVAQSPAAPGGLVTSSLKRGGGGGLVTSALTPDLRVALVPLRGGTDTLRATLEYELQITNAGRGSARSVTVESWLTSAGHDTAADLAGLFASPAGQPMLAPFDLLASAAIDLSGVGVAPRDTLATITAGERRMFVPVLAVRIGFLDGRGSPRATTAAFLVGIARDGQERLAPLPLDRGARMYDRLATRPFA